jgi:hypothetical protein
MGPARMTIMAASEIALTAPVIKLTAAIVKVNASVAKFSGIVKCQTLITTSVVSSSYTPGAGNIW